MGFREGENLFTTEEAVREVTYGELQVARLEAMLKTKAIKTLTPSPEAAATIGNVCQKMKAELSETDRSLLAAALDLSRQYGEVYVVTDDYTVQRIALSIGLRFVPLKHPGLRRGF
ncbi:MAG: hypothetical protein RMJ28_02360 [Nitrososphaerota archaeon]|nr:hypothetical protein [Candidatus Calditenuaceae archaeon]MDW8073065.1 hypothetical protein [Nitrososphaerota archaeon]